MLNNLTYIVSMLLLALCDSVLAGEWYYQTNFSSHVEADSNKRLRNENEKGVVGAIARTDIKISNVTEISEFYVRGALRSVRYDGDDDRGVDTDDQLLYAGGRWNGERSQLTIDGEFTRQSSQFTELKDTGFLEDVNRRVDKELVVQYVYSLTEKAQVFLGGSYNETEFPNSIPVSLTEFTVEGINTGLVYNFNESNSVTFSAFHSEYEAETFISDVESNGTDIRYDRTINEQWSGYLGAGYRKSNFKNGIPGNIVREDDTGSLYEIGAMRESELSTFSIDISNSLEPSADGDVNERTELNFEYKRSFSDRFSGSFTLNWFEDESVNDDQEADREYWTLSLGANYRLTQNWYLTGLLRHRDQKTDTSSNTLDADSNAAIVGVRFKGNNNRI